jgi:small-conductance mechanosensitive channel
LADSIAGCNYRKEGKVVADFWPDWVQTYSAVFIISGIVLLALIIHFLLIMVVSMIAKKIPNILENSLVRHTREPLRWFIALIVLMIVLPLLKIAPNTHEIVMKILSSAFIAVMAWLLMRIVLVVEDHILNRFDIEARDNLQARKVHTQVQFVGRLANVIIALIAFAVILMRFERVQEFGTSILASAGIVGIVVGFAAQRSIGTLLAGMQIAWTQPIRIDDVVIVENEWGRIEEITLTYVVVRIWDQRRLVLPITYFVEKPFQNWTRVSSEILGTVYLYVDYTVPVQAIRDELQKILDNSELWDRRVCVLQVTNSSEKTVELRALMSASDASNAWGLRCEVREKLIAFIQKNYPNALPRLRTEFSHVPMENTKDM